MLRRFTTLAAVLVLAACGGTEPEPVASVNVTAPSANVIVGQTLQVTATPQDANGRALSGRKVTWTSGNQGIATVSGAGLVTGVSGGTVQINAESGGQTGNIVLQVGFPYPNIAGSYAYAATMDGLPSSSTNGVGVVAIAQGDRTKPEIQMSPIVNWVIGTSSYNFAGAHAATVSTTGAISFRMGPAGSSATTWQHTGTRTPSGGFTGRHTLGDGTQSFSGNWAMVRTSGAQAMLLDRGVGVPGTADDVLRALRAR